MTCRALSSHVIWVAAVIVLLAGTDAANAQGSGTPLPAWAKGTPGKSTGGGITAPTPATLPGAIGTVVGSSTGGTTTGGSSTTGGGLSGTGGPGGTGNTGGSSGGFGFGGLDGILSPDQEFLVLLDAIVTTEMIIETTGMQGENGWDLLFLFLMVYTDKYFSAVQAVLDGGTGGTGMGGTPGTGTGTGTGTGMGTGTGTGTGTGMGTGMGTGTIGTTPIPTITKPTP